MDAGSLRHVGAHSDSTGFFTSTLGRAVDGSSEPFSRIRDLGILSCVLGLCAVFGLVALAFLPFRRGHESLRLRALLVRRLFSFDWCGYVWCLSCPYVCVLLVPLPAARCGCGNTPIDGLYVGRPAHSLFVPARGFWVVRNREFHRLRLGFVDILAFCNICCRVSCGTFPGIVAHVWPTVEGIGALFGQEEPGAWPSCQRQDEIGRSDTACAK